MSKHNTSQADMLMNNVAENAENTVEPEVFTNMDFIYRKDGKELWLATPMPQRRFDNMLYNKGYFAMIDQCGNGPGKHMVDAGYSNLVVADKRIIYVRDDNSGEFFSVGFGPCYKEYQSYCCGAGLNYQIIENITDGLKVVWRIFVPVGYDPVEIWDVRIENTGNTDRTVSIFTCVEMPCDGVDTYGGGIFRYAAYYPDVRAIFVRADAEKFTEIDFPLHNGFIAADRKPDYWDAHLEKFIGSKQTLQNPIAVQNGRCGNSDASVRMPSGSLQFRMRLKTAQTQDIRCVVGACEDMQTIEEFRKKYLDGSIDRCRHFDELANERGRMMENITVDTSEDAINKTLNIWGKQQSHYLATWCRWGYKGYRDIVQMSMGTLYWDTELAKRNLLDAMRHQYRDGFALRGWNPLDPMRYVDCGSWLIAAVTEYIKETGDRSFLDKTVPYFDGGEGTVYEHLMRVMERLHKDRGEHRLCLAFFGDWNDSLTGVCKKGKGESVWMSMAFCRCAMLMAELADHLGKEADAEKMRICKKDMADAINTYAWDGRWYLCALDDDGRPVGSKTNEQGRIFLNVQSWAQLGQICDTKRWESALAAVDEYLDSGWGLQLNWPTYLKPEKNIGRLSYLRPGICENGSVYTHGNAFFYMAFLERRMADRALRLWQDIHPSNPNRPVKCQPNIFANGYFGPDSDINPGEAEHMWTTGSAAWLISCTIEYMLGLRRTYEGIVIKPCLPSAWKTASIVRHFRQTTYRVKINKAVGIESPAIKSITVDGAEHPAHKPLPIDGKEHEVIVSLGMEKD
jgi:cellobiose phosphorylase